MAPRLGEIAELLCCPDDAERLGCSSGELLCPRCSRRFPTYGENMAEILPGQPRELPDRVSREYRAGYIETFRQSYQDDATSLAWGAEESASVSWVSKRRRQVEFIRPLITEGSRPGEAVLCDISGGAGYYTFAYAPLFRLVLHCDLSVSNLSYARRKARALGIENIFFLRADYFAPPLRAVDRVLCVDTLIRGEAHEEILLDAMCRLLAPDGVAVVDFHNWWHNPLRRLGFLGNNFSGNRSYTRGEAERLLRSAGNEEFRCFPFVQEFAKDNAAGRYVASILPATRLVYRVGRRKGTR